jgi:hypothetical protein
MRTKVLFPLMVALTVIVLLGCPTPVTSTDTVINIAAIPGVTAPVLGGTPVTAITETAQYTGTVAWNGTPATFAASTVYTATITLTAKAGYTLTGVAANSFTIAGATATNAVNSGVVTAIFPATGAAPDTVINIAAIPGVTAPVFDATPVTAITETAQYTGTIAWYGTPTTFAASTVYTATITLTAKAGYTLTGVAANSFTVAGATATNTVNSGVVTAVFPATGAAPDTVINIAAIPGVTAPVNSGVVTAVFPATGAADYLSANIGTLKYVPAGSFQRDGTATNISTISTAYWMSQYEITRAQFAALFSTDPSNATYSSGTGDPVQRTNWYHAIAFCNKLSLAEGLTPVYAVTGVDFSTLTYASTMPPGMRPRQPGRTTATAYLRRWNGCGRPWERPRTDREEERIPLGT